MQSETQIEAAARAICAVKGLNPDCLHQINVFDGKEPFDSEDDRGRRYVIGWRLQEKIARAALEAALSTDAEPVKTAPAVAVKALEWKRSGWVEAFSQPDGLGVWYSISPDKPVHGPGDPPFKLFVMWGIPGNTDRREVGATFQSLDEAKAAAQADYEARIRSALSAQVQDVAETELKSIDEMLMAGQGDDDGSQIMPDFEVGMSVAAKVEACLTLLEYRRDVIDGYAAVGDWRDDPAQDERWNAGLDFAMLQLCKFLKVDPQSINWDCATETLEGDAQSQIHKVLAAAPAAKQGEAEWLDPSIFDDAEGRN